MVDWRLSARRATRLLPLLAAAGGLFALALLLAPSPASEAATTAASAGCRVYGQVTDASGAPVAGIEVTLSAGRELLQGATDASGAYSFDLARGGIGSADAALSVELRPRAAASGSAKFAVMYRQRLPRLASDSFTAAATDCRRDFDVANLPAGYQSLGAPLGVWPDLIQIYQGTRTATLLAPKLGVRLPASEELVVYAWCNDEALGCLRSQPGSPSDFAGFLGSLSDGSYSTSAPYVVLGDATSARGNGGSPDNREYHEVGHYVQHVLFDALPYDAANLNHGGYYRNPSTADSWVEGFAEFYSVMVSKHIDGDSAPERYRLAGAEYDLEADHAAWEWSGWWEELAVAAVLLDLEDGDADYRGRGLEGALRVDASRVARSRGGPLVEGAVTNTSSGALRNAEVVAEFLDPQGNVVYRVASPAVPSTLPSGSQGTFLIPVPPPVVFSEVRIVPGPAAFGDDDPLDLDLRRIVNAIRDYRSSHPQGNGRLFDVAELLDAMSAAFGGTDLDRNGIDDVEQIFIAHGFFADLDGDRAFGPSEQAGLSSHPAYAEFGELAPRHDLPEAPESVLTIESGDVATQALVQLAIDGEGRGYGYVTDLDEDGRLVLAVPPEGASGTLSIVALADGYEPVVAAHFDLAELWAYWEANPGMPLPPIQVLMQPGSAQDLPIVVAGPGGGNRGFRAGGLPVWALIAIGGIASSAVITGYAVVAHSRYRSDGGGPRGDTGADASRDDQNDRDRWRNAA